ncbi:MAG: hypothetical protein JWO08_215 [Verrucomicrobiaceae bacterium]|nr:hypothetical protein [Verrucomicrobiaceae bacterium]
MHRSISSLAACLSICGIAIAQESKNAPPYVPPVPTLTPAQVAGVLKQLDELEKSILSQRGNTLGAIIQKLHAAAASDAAAINFLTDCDKLVNVERKDGDRKDAKQIEKKKEAEKREPRGPDADKEGDFGTGLRLCLEYLALTLEARDLKDKDMATFVPKIKSFHQNVLSQGKKIKGRAGDMLMQPVGSGGGGGRRGGGATGDMRVIVEAYQLDQFLRRPNWPMVPGDIMDMYDKVIIESARKNKKEDMPALWDAALNLEASVRKLRLADGDFTVWEQSTYPNLRWQRASDLVATGPNPVNGMADMLKVIKDYPGHPNSPEWVRQLRAMVAPPKPGEEADKDATAAK